MEHAAAHAVCLPDSNPLPLTEMEYQILERLRWGRMNAADIARDMGYKQKTISGYLSESIYPMLGVHSRVRAVMLLMSATLT